MEKIFGQKTVKVVVSTIDSTIEFAISKNAMGRELFDQIVKTLGLREVWYFGIQYVDKHGENSWMRLDKKISAHDFFDQQPYKLTFMLKYYPEDVEEELILPDTIRHFYNQVKHDIMTGKIYCPSDIAVILASYTLLAQHDEYCSHDTEPINLPIDKMIPNRDQYAYTDADWEKLIIAHYKELDDMTADTAMLEYLKLAQGLETYGMETFEIKNKVKEVILGLNANGLNMFSKDDLLTPKVAFAWSEIRNLSFRGKKFIVQPTDTSSKDLIFFVNKQRTCRQILALCTGNHVLYIRRRKPDSIEVQQMKEQAREEKKQKLLDRQRLKDERLQRLEMEKKLHEVEEKMRRRDTDYEELAVKVSYYKQRMDELRESLDQERVDRERLLSNQEQLAKLNEQLKLTANTTVEERARLQAERDSLQARIESQNAEIASNERDKLAAEAELRLLWQKTGELHTVMEDDSSQDGEQGDREFEVEDNLIKPEDTQVTEFEKNAELKLKLDELKSNLEAVRDTSKMRDIDHLHAENVRIGVDKFKTLRNIRQGNTKRRVDQFECM